MLLNLKQNITYGPVQSRRLGSSLGINILGNQHKICTFNCLYCQYGWTRVSEVSKGNGLTLPSVEEVMQAVEAALSELTDLPDYLTFSGNGEATLHPRFPEMVEELTQLRDRMCPSTKTAILSNSSTMGDPAAKEAIGRLDAPIMKLDAGDEPTFRRFNNPVAIVNLEDVVQGLADIEHVVIQSLFSDGPAGNLTRNNIDEWVNSIRRIAPKHVQVYSLFRGFPSKDISPADTPQLEHIKSFLDREGIPATVY